MDVTIEVEHEEKDALEMETAILIHFSEMRNPKVKKVVKLAKMLLLTHTHRIEQRLLKDIIYHTDPVGFVNRSIDLLCDFSELIPKFIAEGYHAMVILDKDVYPAKVKAPAHWLVREHKWTADDEYEIQKKVLGEFLETYDRNYALGKVTLFSDFGFSGIPRIIEGRRRPEIAA